MDSNRKPDPLPANTVYPNLTFSNIHKVGYFSKNILVENKDLTARWIGKNHGKGQFILGRTELHVGHNSLFYFEVRLLRGSAFKIGVVTGQYDFQKESILESKHA
jgi:hypothetical protein